MKRKSVYYSAYFDEIYVVDNHFEKVTSWVTGDIVRFMGDYPKKLQTTIFIGYL